VCIHFAQFLKFGSQTCPLSIRPLKRFISGYSGMVKKKTGIAVHTGSCWKEKSTLLYIQAASRVSAGNEIIQYSLMQYTVYSQYRDWLRIRRHRDRSSSPSRGKNFPFSMSSRPVLVPPTTSHPTGTGGYSQEVRRPWCEAVHSQLLQSSRTREPTHSLCHTPSCGSA
jgi:hypothetical protein